jgi:hypothetical protein
LVFVLAKIIALEMQGLYRQRTCFSSKTAAHCVAESFRALPLDGVIDVEDGTAGIA